MRFPSVVLAGLLCLLTGAAAADITRVSPPAIPVGGEEFLTIYGTDLFGRVSTTVVFDGQYEVEPSVVELDRLIVAVPHQVGTVTGTHTVAVRAFDGTSTRVHGPATFVVALPPNEGPPLLSLPEVLIEEAESAKGANVLWAVSAVSVNGAAVPVLCSHRPGALYPLGTTVVQCSATDSGGTSTDSFTILVTDTTAPELALPDNIESANPVVTFTATAADDVDGQVPVNCSPASGATFPTGRTRVRCSAIDAHLNIATDFFFVRVTGGPPPLEVPDDILAEATSAAGAVVTYAVSAEGATSVSCTPPSGSTFALGTTVVTCTASNAAGSISASFRVTVEDHSGPVLTLPGLLEAEATSPAGAIVTYVATATDAVDGPRPVDCVPASGTFFAFGTTSVSCSSFDTRGNETASTFDVVVSDTTAPTITVATANPSSLWPPNHAMVPVKLTAEATDAVDPAPSIRIVSVSSNQPVNGTGDGDTAPDWVVTGPLTLQLRAERAGSNERVYTITVAATDLYGNVSTATVSVRVTESRRRSVR